MLGLGLAGGLLGVGVFFTLSGCLITGILLSAYERTGGLELRRFWVHRARRLLPGLVLMLVVTLAGVYHSSLSLFTIDLTHATLDAADAKDILENIEGGLPKNIQTDIDNLDLNNININDGDLKLFSMIESR